MKNLIFFALLLLISGCQAPKDRSGDSVPPRANPNSNDPNVKTQVEPRVIVLTREDLKISETKDTAQINKMEKDNLAEQSIEKTFTFVNVAATDVALRIEANPALRKSECVDEKNPLIATRLVLVKNEQGIRTVEVDTQPGNDLLVPAATVLELTMTVTNPGQCKNLSYLFVVSRTRD